MRTGNRKQDISRSALTYREGRLVSGRMKRDRTRTWFPHHRSRPSSFCSHHHWQTLQSHGHPVIRVCCCCCQVTSVVSDSVRPHGRQPTRVLCPWDSSGKNTGVSCHFLLQCMRVESGKWKVKVKSLSHVWPLETPWSAAHQAPLPMGFSRQEYWSGLPLPSPTHVWETSNDCQSGFCQFVERSKIE